MIGKQFSLQNLQKVASELKSWWLSQESPTSFHCTLLLYLVLVIKVFLQFLETTKVLSHFRISIPYLDLSSSHSSPGCLPLIYQVSQSITSSDFPVLPYFSQSILFTSLHHLPQFVVTYPCVGLFLLSLFPSVECKLPEGRLYCSPWYTHCFVQCQAHSKHSVNIY